MSITPEQFCFGPAIDEQVVDKLVGLNSQILDTAWLNGVQKSVDLILTPPDCLASKRVDSASAQSSDDVRTAQTTLDRFRTHVKGTIRFEHQYDDGDKKTFWEILAQDGRQAFFVTESHLMNQDGTLEHLSAKITSEIPVLYREKLKLVKKLAEHRPSHTETAVAAQEPIGKLRSLGRRMLHGMVEGTSHLSYPGTTYRIYQNNKHRQNRQNP